MENDREAEELTARPRAAGYLLARWARETGELMESSVWDESEVPETHPSGDGHGGGWLFKLLLGEEAEVETQRV